MGDEQKPDVTFEDESVEVLVEGIDEIPEDLREEEESEKPTLEEIQAELEAEKKKNEALSGQADQVGALTQAFQGLSQQLDPMRQPQKTADEEWVEQLQAAGQQRQVDPETLKKEINENFVDDPVAAMNRLIDLKMGPAQSQVMVNTLKNSRALLEVHQTKGETFKRYQAEIEAEVKKATPLEKAQDLKLYERAHDIVMSRHLSDLVAERVTAELERRQKENPVSDSAPEPGHTERTREVGPRPRVRKVVLTREQAADADRKGIEREDYATYLRAIGEIK